MDNLLTLFDLMGALARRRYQVAEQHFSALGLNHTEARLLTLLQKEKGAATQDSLSGSLFVDRSNAGRALRKLEDRGYVERHKDNGDKRTNFVRITSQGRETAAEISNLKKKIARSLFGDLDESEAGVIVNLLTRALPDEKKG